MFVDHTAFMFFLSVFFEVISKLFVIVKMGLEKRKNVSKMINIWIPSGLNLGTC